VYTYQYTVANPGKDPVAVRDFSIDFDAATAGAVLGIPRGEIHMVDNGVNGLEWHTDILPGHVSATFWFQSDDAPVLTAVTADGSSRKEQLSWGSDGNAGAIPAPSTPAISTPPVNSVPEPPVSALLALGCLAAPLRSALGRIARKK
jgi:hypothetical protein